MLHAVLYLFYLYILLCVCLIFLKLVLQTFWCIFIDTYWSMWFLLLFVFKW